jgi:hypothetical protein
MMNESDSSQLMPEDLRQVASLVLSLSAALLYGLLLGSAIIRTVLGPQPTFGTNVVRMTGLLGGLVGSVVTAGFARSNPPVSVQMSARHAMGGESVTAWHTIKPPSRLRRNLLSLGETIGIRASGSLRESLSSGDVIEEPLRARAALWIAVIYLTVYVVVGLAAVVVSFWIETAPEMVSQAGWVWLGTTVSSAYSYFGLEGGS